MSGDYVVGGVIGEGLMGPRSAGRFRPSGHPVSLEEVPSALLERPDFVERLALAGKRAATVADSNVAAVYDLVTVGQNLYVVTELVRGRSLPALLGAEPSLPLPAVMLVVDSVLAGLEGIHRAGIAHGDVCPDVVVVTPAGAVRVTELGVASVLAADPAMPAWPAVEPPEGGSPSVAADLYATGAMLRELVSGMRPEESGEVRGPEILVRLINRSLAGVPEARFITATEFRQELETTATHLLGPGWRVQSDLAGRATRSLGPLPPRRRLGHTVTVSLAGEPPPPPPPTAGTPELSAATAPPMGAASEPPAASPSARDRVGQGAEIAPSPEAPSVVPVGSFGIDPFVPSEEPLTAIPGAEPPSARGLAPHEHGRHRWIWALLGLIVIAAALAAGVVVLREPTASGTSAVAHPLSVGDDVRLAVQPGNTGGCDTTFTFTATGSLSGTGTLTYEWVRSTGSGNPVYTRFSVTIPSSDASFLFTTPLQLTGPATISATVTFQILSPSARATSQTIHYVCSH
ncbi:MAG: protein kinase [Candidatus Dormibacteria bacterium]